MGDGPDTGADLLTGRWDGTTGMKSLPGGNENVISFRSAVHNFPMVANIPGTLGQRGLLRGEMRSISGPNVRFRFMYNPPEVNYAYDIDESKLNADAVAQDPSGLAGISNLVGGSSISFLLYFDRSIEVATAVRKAGPSNDPGQIGVMHDLAVYERLIGDVGSGTVVSKPIKVFFTRGVKAGPGLNFRGIINSTHITFKQFSQEMIPTRMEMSISMRRMYVPGQEDAAAQKQVAQDTLNAAKVAIAQSRMDAEAKASQLSRSAGDQRIDQERTGQSTSGSTTLTTGVTPNGTNPRWGGRTNNG
jgi:hypothetical protein